jgi:hypothetical protein
MHSAAAPRLPTTPQILRSVKSADLRMTRKRHGRRRPFPHKTRKVDKNLPVRVASPLSSPPDIRYRIKCCATMLMNSREVITLVLFQNIGKCRWLPVIR